MQAATALVSRFSKPGKVCAGDYGIKNKAMQKYYIPKEGALLLYLPVAQIAISCVCHMCAGGMRASTGGLNLEGGEREAKSFVNQLMSPSSSDYRYEGGEAEENARLITNKN